VLADAGEGAAIRGVLAAYDETLAAADCYDLDDLVLRAAETIEQPGAEALCDGIRAVFVDEYQDLNPAQVRLLRALVTSEVELTAIGDPDQSIYGFRGADPARLTAFESEWPNARVRRLGRSYRSSETILSAASDVIRRAPGRARARLWSGITGAPHVVTITTATEKAEAERIAIAVEQLLGGTSLVSFDTGVVESHAVVACESFSEIAVLCRLRSQAEPIAEALSRRGMPVDAAAARSLVDAGHAARVVRALWAIAGRAGDAGATPEPPPLDPTTIAEIGQTTAAAEADALLEAVIRQVGADGQAAEDDLGPLRRAARRIAARKERTHGRAERPRQIDALLDWVALHLEADLADPRADRVSVLTIHAAKGLEWKVVFIAGCEDGLLPYRRPGEEPDLEEERRLFFVGMTRAQRLLVLTRAKERTLHGQRMPREVSPFLLDIEEHKLAGEASPARRPRPRDRQLGLF
jgi:DNA helicase-2/ATP-dependent DNA helicase PcrA